MEEPVMLDITLGPEDVENSHDGGDNTCDNCIKVKCLMQIFLRVVIWKSWYVYTYQDASESSESAFTLDKIMHLNINFHKLALTRVSSYIKLPERISNNYEECFKGYLSSKFIFCHKETLDV